MKVKDILKELEKHKFHLTHKGELVFQVEGYAKIITDNQVKFIEEIEKKCKKCGRINSETVRKYSIDVVPLELVKRLIGVR